MGGLESMAVCGGSANLRSRKRRSRQEDQAATETAHWFEAHPGQRIDAQLAENALHRLPPEEREVVTLRIWGGLTFEEIAEVLGSSVPTVFRPYRASLAHVRSLMEEPCSFPSEAVGDPLSRYRDSIEDLARASRHEQCDWQLPTREMGVHVRLPHLSNLRDVARLVALDARLRIKQQQYDLAVEQLRVGMTLARHVGQGSTLIEGLVGLAIHGMMLDQLEALVQAPDAPNLYWALTDLPPASLNAWHATRWERCFVYVHLPALWEKRTRPVTASDLRQSIIGFQRMSGGGFRDGMLSADEQANVISAAIGAALYPRARQSLIDQGRPEESVNALPVAQVIADYIGGAYAQQRDNMFKWFALPYYQARAGLDQAMKELESGVTEDPASHVISRLFLPALGRVAEKFAQLDRRLAALRCVEAVRLHAASHEGRLPSELAEIKEVPKESQALPGFAYRVINSSVVGAPESVMNRLDPAKGFAPKNLDTAFASGPQGVIQIGLFPYPGLDRVVTELMPVLPGMLGGGPSAPVAEGFRWAMLGLQSPSLGNLDLVIRTVSRIWRAWWFGRRSAR